MTGDRLRRRRSGSAPGVLLGVLSLLAAGCGAAVSVRPATATPAAAPTAAGNRHLAGREAARLLALAQVPPDATRVDAAPHGLAQPATRSGSSSLIDPHAFWTVAMPFAATLAWVVANPPAGLADSGEGGGGSGPGLLVQALVYTGGVGAAWTEAQYEVAVSRLTASTSAIRIDGMADWIDPRPVADSQPGPRLRVTVSTRCAPSDARTVGVAPPAAASGADLSTRLVPDADPTAGRVCRYAGFNGPHPRGLVADEALSARQARRVAAAAAALPLGHDSGAVYNCPADTGETVAIALAYPGRRDVDLWFTLTGCPTLANGRISTWAGAFGASVPGVSG